MTIGNTNYTAAFNQTVKNGINNPDIVNLIQQCGFEGFLQLVAMGEVAGASFISKFGENPDVDTGAAEDIWSQGGLYVFSTSADIDTISSSDAADTQQVTIFGLDTNWEASEQTIALNGQTKVSLTTPLVRVYRMANIGAVDLAGIVYCYVDGVISAGVPNVAADIRATITNGDNQTLMAIYTVPAGKTGYLVSGYITAGRTLSAVVTVSLKIRPFGSVFQVKARVSLGTSADPTWEIEVKGPQRIPEKSDVLVRAEDVTANNIGVTSGFGILLIDNV